MRIVRESGGRRSIPVLGASLLLSFCSLVGTAAPAGAVVEHLFAGVCTLGVTTEFTPSGPPPSPTSVGTAGINAAFSGSCVYAPPAPGGFIANMTLRPTGLAGPCGAGVYTASTTVHTGGTSINDVNFEVVLAGATATVVAQTQSAMFLMAGEMVTTQPCSVQSSWTGVFVVEDPTLPV